MKIFLFLSDVDDDSGPTEYIPETRKGGRYASLCPTASGNLPGHLVYPDPDKVAAIIDELEQKTSGGGRGFLELFECRAITRVVRQNGGAPQQRLQQSTPHRS